MNVIDISYVGKGQPRPFLVQVLLSHFLETYYPYMYTLFTAESHTTLHVSQLTDYREIFSGGSSISLLSMSFETGTITTSAYNRRVLSLPLSDPDLIPKLDEIFKTLPTSEWPSTLLQDLSKLQRHDKVVKALLNKSIVIMNNISIHQILPELL